MMTFDFPVGYYDLHHTKIIDFQLRHSIRDLATVEQVLGIRFSREERERLQKTINKFPLNITPYYVSLIDVN